MSKRRRQVNVGNISEKVKSDEKTLDEMNTEEKVDNNICNIDELPDTILVQIFEYLSAWQRVYIIERVSKRWNQLSQCAWTKFHHLNLRTLFNSQRTTIAGPLYYGIDDIAIVAARCGKY